MKHHAFTHTSTLGLLAFSRHIIHLPGFLYSPSPSPCVRSWQWVCCVPLGWWCGWEGDGEGGPYRHVVMRLHQPQHMPQPTQALHNHTDRERES
jgi:hypothetical protein